MADAWLLTTDGDQVPVIPLSDVPGKAGTDAPAQISNVVPKENVGVVLEFTETVKVVVVAHWLAPGVNV